MTIWAANWHLSMRRLLGGGRNLSTLAAAVTRFHPHHGGGISISRSGSPTPAGKSPVPLMMVPPEVVTDISGDATDRHYNFMRINKDERNKELIRIKKMNKLPWEKLFLPDDAVCRGSSHGWLAFVHPRTCELGLFNPFVTNNPFPYLPLPRTETLPVGHFLRIYKADNLSQSPTLIREFVGYCNDNISFDCKELINQGFVLHKLALSSAPVLHNVVEGDDRGYGDCTVVAVAGCTLAFCKLGDSAWTMLKGSFEYGYDDVIYFSKHRRFYAVADIVTDMYYHKQDYIESWDFTDPCCPKNTLIQPSMDSSPTKQFPSNPQGWRIKTSAGDEDGKRNPSGDTRRYLVEDDGNLLMILRFVATMVDKDGFLINMEELEYHTLYEEVKDWSTHPLVDDEVSYITVGFAVYKLDWIENKWEPVESLGDKALFVGLNHSFSVSTHELPDVMGNSIYFTDDKNVAQMSTRYSGGHDSGVYNMEDASISGIFPASLKKIQQHSLWVLPN